MNPTITYIESPRDPELILAWAKVIAEHRTSDGWSYMGSDCTDGPWRHHFRNKRMLEEAQDDEDRAAGRMFVRASEGWPSGSR